MIQKAYDCVIRIMILGDSSVGKTSLISKYINGSFNLNELTTVGIEYRNKKSRRRHVNLKLQLWDTAGDERYHTLTNFSLKDADAVVLAYDISNMQSFKSIQDRWIDMTNQACKKKVIMVLAGNKRDLDRTREVAIEEGSQLALDNGFMFFETSAKENLNIDKMFDFLVDTFMTSEGIKQNSESISIQLEGSNKAAQSCGCGLTSFWK